MTTLELLNEMVNLGMDRDKAIESIDVCLDDYFGFENRKPWDEEEISKEMYDNIIDATKCELEAMNDID